MPTEMLPLGKKPHVDDHRDLLLARYTADLPPLPAGPLGHGAAVPADSWGMLGNDRVGDCVWAGGAHEHVLWDAVQNRHVTFSDSAVLADYSACTGYSPTDPSTDQGTDMRNAMLYRKSTGLLDADGKRHKIEAFAALGAGDIEQLKQSIYLFGVAAAGIEFPLSAMVQFNRSQPWTVVADSPIQGGHYVPIVGWDGVYFLCVTWGRVQLVHPDFLARYMDEGYAPLALDQRKRGWSPEHFNYAQLKADLAALH